MPSPAPSAPPAPRGVALDDRVRRGTRWALRSLLGLSLVLAVLWTGGTSYAAVATLAGIASVGWVLALLALPHKAPRVRMAWPWLAIGGFTALQAVPLPRALVGLLSPEAVTLSDAGRKALDLPALSWLPLALSPGDTALQAALYLVGGTLAALGGVALMGTNSRRVVRWLGTTVLLLAVASALLTGMAHDTTETVPAELAASLKPFLFVNPNHQAGLFNLGVALAAGRAVQTAALGLQTVYGLTAAMLGLAVMLSGSRGGMLSLGLVLALTGLSVVRSPVPIRRDPRDEAWRARRTVALMISAIALMGAIVALPVIDRELDGTEGDPTHEPKIQTLLRLPEIVAKAPLFGLGPGGLAVLAARDPEARHLRADFAENLLAERLIDNGLLVTVLFVVWLGWIGAMTWRRASVQPASLPLVVTIVSLLVHNLVDFSLEIAGGLVPWLLLGTAMERTLSPTDERGRSAEYRQRRRRHGQILVATGASLAVALPMLGLARGHLTRDVDPVLAPLDVQAARTELGARFTHDSYAFYLYGRKLTDAGQAKQALQAYDRSLEMRPASVGAHLYRFASRLEVGDSKGAADDLVWLLQRERDVWERAMLVAMRSKLAEELLIEVVPRAPERAYELGVFFEISRPDLVERMALKLRQAFPDRRYGIEVLRARLYVKRGMIEPAKRISAALLADPRTVVDGYTVEATILSHTGKPYEAFHLYKAACDKRPQSDDCVGAVQAILAAHQPLKAEAYIRSLWPIFRSSQGRSAFYWSSLAEAQLQSGQVDDAVESARSAYGQSGHDLATSLHLAECLLRAGQHGELLEVARQAKDRYGNDKRVQELWQRVQRETSSAILPN